jgi:tripartite-type tricarboxylate transporter receptor subunit TctC
VAQFAAAEFARLAKLELRHVVYRGTPAALPDLLAGRIPMYMASTAELMEQYRVGRIRILATTDVSRSPFSPNIATFRESGFDILTPAWFAVYAPAKTPPTPPAASIWATHRLDLGPSRTPGVHTPVQD